MSLFTAIFLIFLSFAGGYCLSGMLGAGTMEDIQRELTDERGNHQAQESEQGSSQGHGIDSERNEVQGID